MNIEESFGPRLILTLGWAPKESLKKAQKSQTHHINFFYPVYPTFSHHQVNEQMEEEC